jgi:hypothetical protein
MLSILVAFAVNTTDLNTFHKSTWIQAIADHASMPAAAFDPIVSSPFLTVSINDTMFQNLLTKYLYHYTPRKKYFNYLIISDYLLSPYTCKKIECGYNRGDLENLTIFALINDNKQHNQNDDLELV